MLGLGTRTSNTAVRGDLGLTTCFNKQKLSCIRLKSKLVRANEDRLISKVTCWAKRRRKGWHCFDDKLISQINATDIVNNTTISIKCVTQIIKEKLCEIDDTKFSSEINNDRKNPNGNKLRTYRLYKKSVELEQYIQCQIPGNVRRTITLFRSGALPIAVETGRYSRPQTPLDRRLCTYAT